MQCICPRCPRRGPEEIIGDESPKCRTCGQAMVRATSSYKGLWLSPSFVIHRMRKIVETYGIRDAHANGRFKKEREASPLSPLSALLSPPDTLYVPHLL